MSTFPYCLRYWSNIIVCASPHAISTLVPYLRSIVAGNSNWDNLDILSLFKCDSRIPSELADATGAHLVAVCPFSELLIRIHNYSADQNFTRETSVQKNMNRACELSSPSRIKRLAYTIPRARHHVALFENRHLECTFGERAGGFWDALGRLSFSFV